MKDYRIREYEPSDIPGLKALWHTVFGDPSSLLDRFFLLLPQIGSCCLAEAEGRIVGAAYILTDFTLRVPGQSDLRCGYLYAVATEEAWRGNGIGRTVSVGAAALGKKGGADLICTLPAEGSLYEWYASILNLSHISTRRVYFSDEISLLVEPGSFSLLPISETAYLSCREELLHSFPHIVPGPAVFSFQTALCETYGGGLFRYGENLLCAYKEDHTVKIVEFLSRENVLPFWLSVIEVQRYVCSDMPLPEEIVWNITLD